MGQLISATDPDGVTMLFSYDAQGRIWRKAVDMNGNGQIDLTDGNTSAPDDRIEEILYDTLATGAGGNTRGVDITRIRRSAYLNNDSSTTGPIETVERATDGRRTWTTKYRDTGGTTPVTTSTEVGLPSSGSRTDKSTRPDGSYSEKVYTNGRLTTERERNSAAGQVTSKTIAYDTHGRVASETDALNGATSFDYYSSDAIFTITAPALGNGEARQVNTSYYDSMGRLIGTLKPDATSTSTTYNLTSLVQRQTGSETYPVEYLYDGQGRVKTMKTWQIYNAGSGTPAITTWNYDQHRGWLSSKDYANASTGAAGTAGPTYTYTDAGRLLTRVWERGVATTYEYKVGSGSSLTAGDLRTVTYAGGAVSTPSVTYTYDRRGRRATVVQNGITTTLVYNEAGQPLSETHSGGTMANLAVVRTYDTSLRVATVDARRSGSSFQLAGYTYDTSGRLDQVRENNGTQFTAKYNYLANSDLAGSVVYTNTATGEGMLTVRSYDKLSRLSRIRSESYLNSALAANGIEYSYQYNDANQRTRTDEGDGSYWIYEYDSLGQVVAGRRFWGDGGLMNGQNFEYKFDDIGNRDTTGGRGSSVSDYTANQLNQYTQRTVPTILDVIGVANPTAGVQVWKDSDSPSTASRQGEYFHHPLGVANTSYPIVYAKSLFGATLQATVGRSFVPAATETFGYDADGNLTSDGRWTAYVWDGENRLVEMRRDTSTPTLARQRLTFEYDHLGRRIRKTYFTHNGTTWVEQRDTIYLYDGWQMLAELDANASNGTLRSYVWGTDLSGTKSGAGGVGGLLWLNNVTSAGGLPTGIQFAAYDGNGNVAGLFSATTGAETATYEYGPFGEPLRATGSLAGANPVRWSSKATDDETGLVYYGYRFLNTTTGQWVNRDPISDLGHRLNAGMTITRLSLEEEINLRLFARNNPISRTDSDGRWLGPLAGVGAGIALGCYANNRLCRLHRDTSFAAGEGEANRNAPDGSTHRGTNMVLGGDADALTHCITACNMAKEPSFCGGLDRALDWLQRRETGNDIFTDLDRMNNENGFGIGMSKPANCTEACMRGLCNGFLNEVRDGQIVRSSCPQ